MKNNYRNNYDSSDATRMFMLAVLLPYLAVFVLYAVYTVVANAIGMQLEEFEATLPVLMINAVFMQVCFALLLFVYNKKQRVNFVSAAKLKSKPNAWMIAIGVCMGFSLMWFSNPAMNLFESGLTALGCDLRSDLGFALDNAGTIIFALLALGILPAFVEEFIFRGVILQGLRKYGNWFAIIISAVLFMLIHGNIQQTIYQFAFGVLAGYLVIKTGSLWISIIIHAVNNTVIVALNSIQTCMGVETTAPNIDVFYILQAVLYLGILAVIIIFGLKLINKVQNRATRAVSAAQNPCAGSVSPDGTAAPRPDCAEVSETQIVQTPAAAPLETVAQTLASAESVTVSQTAANQSEAGAQTETAAQVEVVSPSTTAAQAEQIAQVATSAAASVTTKCETDDVRSNTVTDKTQARAKNNKQAKTSRAAQESETKLSTAIDGQTIATDGATQTSGAGETAETLENECAKITFKRGFKLFREDKTAFKDGILGLSLALLIAIVNTISMFMN